METQKDAFKTNEVIHVGIRKDRLDENDEDEDDFVVGVVYASSFVNALHNGEDLAKKRSGSLFTIRFPLGHLE